MPLCVVGNFKFEVLEVFLTQSRSCAANVLADWKQHILKSRHPAVPLSSAEAFKYLSLFRILNKSAGLIPGKVYLEF